MLYCRTIFGKHASFLEVWTEVFGGFITQKITIYFSF
jgi:hypothetical protein